MGMHGIYGGAVGVHRVYGGGRRGAVGVPRGYRGALGGVPLASPIEQRGGAPPLPIPVLRKRSPGRKRAAGL